MVSFSSLFLAGSAIAGVFGAPRPDLGKTLSKRTTATPNGEGMGNDGFFYSIWSDGGDDMTFTNGADGEYSLNWSGSGDVVCGKGWKTGSDQNITYSGTYEPDGGSFLSIYGWFTDPLTEYYILENYGTADPSYGTELVGNLTSDGSVYSIHKTVRVNAASIEGTTTFNQFWSIRQDKRVGGTINTANHFNAWKAAGLEFSGFHYQIIATEGISGSGKSNIKIAAAGSADASSSAAQPSSAAPSPSTASSVASSAVSPVAYSTTEPATSSPVSSPASSVVNPVVSSVASSIAVSPTISIASSSVDSIPSSAARSSEVSSTIAATTSSATSSAPSFSATSIAAPAVPSGASSATSSTSSTEEVVATTTVVTTTEVTVTIFASDTGTSKSAPTGNVAQAGSWWHHHSHPRDQTFGHRRL
ncbi:glycoside hydrolase family 11 protein [Viridothelium virens]|uniref:endo-1,4-beta-xylanase n=1 Tax=Viridothelium virens TaxID=1048519 RepID=A0A6A6HP92_VIRVR|nr:glycoside hydrolase family 11 protein [Viridothelium virens]